MDYQTIYDSFSWDEVNQFFDWNPKVKFNMAHEICDKWLTEPNRVAIVWEDEDGNVDTWTYKRLAEKSNQMAYYLQSLGVEKGERVAGLLGKDMELIVTILATWKMGAIYVPLFTAFGPEAIVHRLNDAQVKIVLTSKLYHECFRNESHSTHVIEIDEVEAGKSDLFERLESFSTEFPVMQLTIDTPCAIQYTSGSTGMPKGAVWSHKMLVSEYPLFKYAFGVEKNDIVYGGADLGWAHGLINCTLGPLMFGVKSIIYKGKFDVTKTLDIWEKYNVTNVITSPTALRMMIPYRDQIVNRKFNLQKISTAGETLTNEVIAFVDEYFKIRICDIFGATETGLVIGNFHKLDVLIKAGSMGKRMPGYLIRLVNEEGEDVGVNEVGEIIIDTNNVSYFCLGYWNNQEVFNSKVKDGYYYMGDRALFDEDGYFWYRGRVDDVISSAGYRIGPTEIENCLLNHDAVAEAAVIGRPDLLKGEIVKAYVRLHDTNLETDEMKEELSQYVKKFLSKHQYPKEIEFIRDLPKTASGKIQRFELKKREQLIKNN